MHYGLASGGRSHYYIGGFAPDLAKAGPGTLAIGHAVEEALREGNQEFHVLRGQEPDKHRWGALDRWSRRRTLFPRG